MIITLLFFVDLITFEVNNFYALATKENQLTDSNFIVISVGLMGFWTHICMLLCTLKCSAYLAFMTVRNIPDC